MTSSLALSSSIQPVGVEVRRGDDRDTVGVHRVEQPVQDHRVGDIRDVELVEADQPEAPPDALAQLVQRVGDALEFLQLAVDFAHELVEMQPCLALQRHGLEEAVHQEAFPAPHPAVHVDTARQRWTDERLGQRIAAA
jgi:hypothetical protein